MAATEFGTSHPLTVKAYSKTLATEAFRKTFIGKFMGKGEDSLIQEKVELKKGAGDRITYGLSVQLQGEGTQGDATLQGNEEAMQFYDDAINIDQLRHAVTLKGKMTEQRTAYNLRETAKARLSDWWAVRMDTCLANQLCGNTAQTDTRFTGNMATLAPTSNRILRAGNQATDQALTSADTFELSYIDIARQRAMTASTAASTGPVIRPLLIDGAEMYVMFLHPYQVHDLRTNTSAGGWMDIQQAALKGGDVKNNPIFTGALGIYNGVVLHEWARVTEGVHSTSGAAVTTARRAVLCGAQAAMIAFGGDGGDTRYDWQEEREDYKNRVGFSAGTIFGLKKTRFTPANDSATNAEDFGTIVVSTYAAAATMA